MSAINGQQSTVNGQRGYTLIEVLIASSIFLGVILIGTASFTTSDRVRSAVTQQMATTETVRAVAEALVRDIRAATGQQTSGVYTTCPYDFLDDQTLAPLVQPGDSDLLTSRTLVTNRFDASLEASGGSVVSRRYRAEELDGRLTLGVTVPGEESESLLPDGYSLSELTFQGLSHRIPGLRSQPFVQIQFTVVEDRSGAAQSLQTAVTSREPLLPTSCRS